MKSIVSRDVVVIFMVRNGLFIIAFSKDENTPFAPQGQRTLSCISSKDFHQEVDAPSGHAAFHDIAILARMLLDQA